MWKKFNFGRKFLAFCFDESRKVSRWNLVMLKKQKLSIYQGGVNAIDLFGAPF